MGQQNSRINVTSHRGLSNEEEKVLASSFKSISKGKKLVSKEDLKSAWDEDVDAHLLKMLLEYLFEDNSDINFDKFLEPLLYIIRGSEEEKVTAVYKMLASGSKEVKLMAAHSYVECIFTSYIDTYKIKKTKNYESWKLGQDMMSSDQLKALVNNVCKDLPDCSEISVSDLTVWVSSWNMLFVALQKVVFSKIYNILDEEALEIHNMIPFYNRMSNDHKFPSILSWPSIIFLNAGLPSKLQNEWRLLFSTATHGESFSKLIGLVMNQGPTAIIVRDTNGHVFGGFASCTWTLSPNFVGDSSCFLFSILPVMEKFDPTGYNDHYQYLNVQQQTLPNGLGMGGQHGYFGFWLDAEFGSGHCSETCTTFKNYHMLSGQKQFQIDHVEVWGLGPKQEIEEESRGRSVLDTETEARAVMEMAGKVQYSDGYREPEEES